MTEDLRIRMKFKPKRLFQMRVAGIAFRDGHVLVHRATHEKFWSFPGGRAEMGEETKETLAREMVEELGVEATVGRLLWVVENFFEYNNIKHHEIGFYYQMEISDLENQDDFIVTEDETELLFHWEEIDKINPGSIYPEVITKDLLLNTSSIQHITQNFKNLNVI